MKGSVLIHYILKYKQTLLQVLILCNSEVVLCCGIDLVLILFDLTIQHGAAKIIINVAFILRFGVYFLLILSWSSICCVTKKVDSKTYKLLIVNIWFCLTPWSSHGPDVDIHCCSWKDNLYSAKTSSLALEQLCMCLLSLLLMCALCMQNVQFYTANLNHIICKTSIH